MRYVVCLIVIAICVLVIWKSSRLGEIIPIPWAEQKFSNAGQAGTVTFYRLAALILIVLSALYMFGALQAIILKIFGGGRA